LHHGEAVTLQAGTALKLSYPAVTGSGMGMP
jgi:hypothetical protein